MDVLLEVFDNIKKALVENVVELLPNLGLSLIVVLVGIAIAWMARRVTIRLILYIDRKVNERLSARLLKIDLQSIAKALARAVFWTIILFTIAVIIQILGMSILTTWVNDLIKYIPNILAVLLIIVFGIVSGKLAGDLISSASARAGLTTGNQLGRLVHILILVVTFIIAIDQIGIDMEFLTNILTIVVASLLFAAALAFGLGANVSVSNILGSYYLQQVYREGDRVRINEIEGIIIRITATVVLIETESGRVVIPSKVFNESKSELIKSNK